MTIVRNMRPALVVFLFLSVVTGLLYPLAMTGLAAYVLPRQAGGSLVMKGDRLVGSTLIGQDFADARYFHGRPSVTVGPDPADPSKTVPQPYNAASSMASNAGPTSRALVERVAAAVSRLKADNPEAVLAGLPVPMDLVTSSGSGLDPDISPQGALFQVARVARVRHLREEAVRALVDRMVERPPMGWLGEPRVNVLELNLALDTLR